MLNFHKHYESKSSRFTDQLDVGMNVSTISTSLCSQSGDVRISRSHTIANHHGHENKEEEDSIHECNTNQI